MRANRLARRPQTQLIPHRGVLSKINPVVRKKSKPTNTQVPKEWGEDHAQAYRLLVGPKINEYIPPPPETPEPEKIPEKDLRKMEKEKLLSKLVPSRLNTPVEPVRVTNESLERMHFPPDLLVQIFPPDHRPRFDLLSRYQTKRPKTSHIVKPKFSSKTTSRADGKSPFQTEVLDYQTENINNSLISNEEDDEYSQTEIFIKVKSDDNEEEEIFQIVPQHHEEDKQDSSQKIYDSRQAIKVRQMFYVLRCWAKYNTNARIKAMFIIDVIDTHKKLDIFRKWFRYVKFSIKIRILLNKAQNALRFHRYMSSWLIWREKTFKETINARKASDYLQIKNRILLLNYFKELRFALRSQKIYRLEIQKYFRYHHNGPFAIVNKYYEHKRKNTLNALYHHFKKVAPIVLKNWKFFVIQNREFKKRIEEYNEVTKKLMFLRWQQIYKDHFHSRMMESLRQGMNIFHGKYQWNEHEASEKVEKTVMVQLIRDKQVLKAKLNQFDRLSSNHYEAVLRRRQMRKEIENATQNYFSKQEELLLIDYNKKANSTANKVREIRLNLADSFLYHIEKAINNFDSHISSQSYCLAFRVLSEPLVNRAVGYFYEKKHIISLVRTAVHQRRILRAVITCSQLYHYGYSWGKWRKFINQSNDLRSIGLMETIRRRRQILELYPYFNWVEVLPVRPPRPLKEVEQAFKDLPLVSIQRKIARERMHHVNVRMMLSRRRMLRDFIRAYASYVQERRATREVMRLMRNRRNLSLLTQGYEAFKINKDGELKEPVSNKMKNEINSNIIAWYRHFFRARVRQRRSLEQVEIV